MKKPELLIKKEGIEKEIKAFTDKPSLQPQEQQQLDKLQDALEAVELEIDNL